MIWLIVCWHLYPAQPAGSLVAQCKTLDQARAVVTFIDAASEKTLSSTVALTAARGRGKVSVREGLAGPSPPVCGLVKVTHWSSNFVVQERWFAESTSFCGSGKWFAESTSWWLRESDLHEPANRLRIICLDNVLDWWLGRIGFSVLTRECWSMQKWQN